MGEIAFTAGKNPSVNSRQILVGLCVLESAMVVAGGSPKRALRQSAALLQDCTKAEMQQTGRSSFRLGGLRGSVLALRRRLMLSLDCLETSRII